MAGGNKVHVKDTSILREIMPMQVMCAVPRGGDKALGSVEEREMVSRPVFEGVYFDSARGSIIVLVVLE